MKQGQMRMRKYSCLLYTSFMVMSVCGYAQKYEVGTTTAVWKAPAAADFLHDDDYSMDLAELLPDNLLSKGKILSVTSPE